MIDFIRRVPLLKRMATPLYYGLIKWKNTYYSQAGEDVVVKYLFDSLGKSNVTCLDLGTNDPVSGNNTYIFYKQGCRSVCVEANPVLARQIRFYRPKDTCLNVAVSTGNEDSLDFYIFDSTGISTLSKEEALIREKSGTVKIKQVIRIPARSINDIIAENFTGYPDFLSIDIEGLDLAVLQTLHFERFPIPVICVETVHYAENHLRSKDHSIGEFMVSKGYFSYADTFINTIFVNRKWYDNYPVMSV